MKYGDISPITSEYASKQFLKVLQPLTVTQRFGQSKELPSKETQTIKWRRYENLIVTTAPIAEGVSPDAQKLTKTDVTAILKQYAYVTELTDVIKDTHTDPILEVCVKRVGQAMSQTIEKVTIAILKAGTSVFYANGSSRAGITDVMTRGTLRSVKRTLARNQAQPITEIIKPGSKVSTMGVEASYFGMCHTDLDSDIRDMVGFKSVVEYASVEKRIAGEVGNVESIRFVATTNFDPWEEAGASQTDKLSGGLATTGDVDVYPVIIVGEDAYGVVRLQGKNAASIYVLNPGVARGNDPVAQRGTVGNKMWYTAVILNENWMARVETACTGTPS